MPKPAPKPDFTIREIEKRDFNDLVGNYFARYDEVKRNRNLGLPVYRKKPSMAKERIWFRDLLKDIMQRKTMASVAEADGRVVGMCDIKPKGMEIESSHVGVLGIAVNEGYRSKGIGTALIKDVIKKSKGRYEIVILHVFGVNKGAIGLYKKLGFRMYGTLKHGYKRGKTYHDDISMYIRP